MPKIIVAPYKAYSIKRMQQLYVVEFIYTKNPYEEKPIIVVDKHIGLDDEDGAGIMGGQFIDEFFGLSGLGKKECEVWINSPGGKMMEAYDMFGVMKRSIVQPDTLNIGVAASCAGWLQLAGKHVKMMDYATFMCHDPSGNGGDEASKAMKLSIMKMISEGSGRNGIPKLTMDKVSELMAIETFISAEDCLNVWGLCDEIVPSGFNKSLAFMADKWQAGKQYLNSVLLNKNNKMENISLVTNELELNEDSNAKAITKAIGKMKNELKETGEKLTTANTSISELTNKLTVSESELTKVKNEMEAKNDYDDLKNKLNEMTDKFNALETENKALKAEKDEAENKVKESEIENACKSMVNKYTNKIGADEAIVKEWTDTAKTLGVDKVENMLKSLPVFGKATTIKDITNKVETKLEGSAMERASATIMAKRKSAKN